jgi:hypothetical protein
MNGHPLNYTGNVVPFRTRSERSTNPADDEQRDNIIRMLDLSKFERPRPAVENDASMGANIAAVVFLGILVFFATEDFSRLGRSNLCAARWECINQ